VRVLVVDDHDRFRENLRVLLEADGLEVGDASSGEAALHRLRSWPADVVVMDLNMPGMSGIEATRRVLEQAPETAVLVLTGAADERSEEHTSELQSLTNLVCRLLLEKKKKKKTKNNK